MMMGQQVVAGALPMLVKVVAMMAQAVGRSVGIALTMIAMMTTDGQRLWEMRISLIKICHVSLSRPINGSPSIQENFFYSSPDCCVTKKPPSPCSPRW
jgi:hypothetical protein